MSAKIPAFSDIGKSTTGEPPFMLPLRTSRSAKYMLFEPAKCAERVCIYFAEVYVSHRLVPAELLYGGGNTGKFQFNNVLNLSSKTADGVVCETA